MGVSHEEAEGGAPADGGGDDFSIIETTPTSVHTQVLYTGTTGTVSIHSTAHCTYTTGIYIFLNLQ